MKIVVDHAHGTKSAAGEALGEFNTEFPVGADGDGMVMGHAGSINSRFIAELLHQIVAPRHRTTECAANTNMVFSGSRLTEARVKSHHFEHLDRLEFEFCRGPFNCLLGEEAEVMLQMMKHWKNR